MSDLKEEAVSDKRKTIAMMLKGAAEGEGNTESTEVHTANDKTSNQSRATMNDGTQPSTSPDPCDPPSKRSRTEPPNSDAAATPALSKSASKKIARQLRIKEKHALKKLRVKEERAARAAASGRDMEAERRVVAERTAEGSGKLRRLEAETARFAEAKNRFGVCVDCYYGMDAWDGGSMTLKEVNSLSQQVMYCYSANRKSERPIRLSASSLRAGTTVYDNLNKLEGFPERWRPRAFSYGSGDIDDDMLKLHEKESLVYLTSDSKNVLTEMDDSKVYVIGGIVDRNRLRRAAISRAEALGVAHARLPIQENVDFNATKVLTVNHVFEILEKVGRYGNDWKKALLEVLPARKEVKEKDGEMGD
eukprot:CAMPEP_0194279980 /NCGR_PEP_ID=MMETSP0169-20130528/14983_1 /TAXON_ID=218684 /ORGANISM="Corethron pennatum, Strain L29A3" /LENGTH=361 /DNA_ID=CAMNT_0039024513 /DNA_START=44 /DNA_END=1129 /DNA_ORIENTATION=+